MVAPASVTGHGLGDLSAHAVVPALAQRLLPSDLLAAYWRAAEVAPARCHLPVTVLMAIGQVESGNLAGHRIDASHRVVPSIVGPVLDGSPFRAIRDTDAGRLDGDATWDRAVGPMQFVPASWRVAGVDMDGDDRRDPQDVYDAAGAAMVYLCVGDRDLSTYAGLRSAILAYNHSRAYLRLVLRWKRAFDAASASPDPGWPVVLDAGRRLRAFELTGVAGVARAAAPAGRSQEGPGGSARSLRPVTSAGVPDSGQAEGLPSVTSAAPAPGPAPASAAGTPGAGGSAAGVSTTPTSTSDAPPPATPAPTPASPAPSVAQPPPTPTSSVELPPCPADTGAPVDGSAPASPEVAPTPAPDAETVVPPVCPVPEVAGGEAASVGSPGAGLP